MKSIVLRLFAALLFAVVPATTRALSEAEASAGRAVVKQQADVVIGVEMVVTIRVSSGGRAAAPRESKVEVNGTVLNASGLTVTSLVMIDPRVQLESMRATMGGSRIEVGETDYKEVKLRLADGTEIPARVVLKDADLDLAFIAPEVDAAAPNRDFPAVDLDHPAEGRLLDTYFSISRAAKALQRVPLVRPTVLTGIVEKPRKLFLVSDHQIGSPVFDQNGAVLGIALQQPAVGRLAGMIVLPAADIADIAKQAEAARLAGPAPSPAPAAGPDLPPDVPAEL